MRAYLTEFIGAFFLVLTIGLTSVSGLDIAPLAIGSALMVMVYMGGHISGAHYNPAVSLACCIRGALPWSQFAPYVLSQILGAIVAGFAVYMITGMPFGPAPAIDASTTATLLVEILFTFALALVVLNVATASKTAGNSFYGLAIGFTVMVGAFAGGGISGGAFNPAVGLGPNISQAFLGAGALGHTWIYVVGPTLGAALAALVFRAQGGETTP
ncbi:MAG TPA: aquaporin [Gemmatimonadaceae bacterium]|nr:aquaporin [Gemmatimonadaceae bacterium]